MSSPDNFQIQTQLIISSNQSRIKKYQICAAGGVLVVSTAWAASLIFYQGARALGF